MWAPPTTSIWPDWPTDWRESASTLRTEPMVSWSLPCTTMGKRFLVWSDFYRQGGCSMDKQVIWLPVPELIYSQQQQQSHRNQGQWLPLRVRDGEEGAKPSYFTSWLPARQQSRNPRSSRPPRLLFLFVIISETRPGQNQFRRRKTITLIFYMKLSGCPS